MEANELRIAYYVKFMLNDEDYEIISIDVKDLELIEEKQGVYEPITLTREWLIKFKFEELEKDCRTFFKKGKFKVELSNGGNVYYNRNIFISSVHQLQNLYFALTGKELTFKSE